MTQRCSWVKQEVFALRKGELDTFRKLLASFLAGIPYSMHRKEEEREHERYFYYMFYLLLRYILLCMFKKNEVKAESAALSKPQTMFTSSNLSKGF